MAMILPVKELGAGSIRAKQEWPYPKPVVGRILDIALRSPHPQPRQQKLEHVFFLTLFISSGTIVTQ